jgi:curved DNA-binding protein CbpA
MQNGQDPYTVLGVSPNANMDDIRHAYRKLAFQYHPDVNQMNEIASINMQRINEAYAVISNPLKRKEIDIIMSRPVLMPKYTKGIAIKISINSSSPYRNHNGIIDREPEKDTFRYWYSIKILSKGYSTVVRVPEEEVEKA